METPGQPTPSPDTPPAPTPPSPTPPPTPPPPPQGSYLTEARYRALAELGLLFRPHWAAMSATIVGPRLEGDGDGDGDGKGGEDGKGDGDGKGGEDGKGTGSGGGTGSGSGSGDWTPPTKDDWERTQRAAADASREAREAKRALNEATGKGETAEQKLERVTGVLKGNAIKSGAGEIARDLGIKSPAIAHRLIDRAGLEVDVDLDGDEPKAELTGAAKDKIKERLEAAIEEAPELAGQQRRQQLPGGGGGGNGAAGTGTAGNEHMNDLLRRSAGRG